MSELELYIFVQECEYHWDYKNRDSKEKDEVFLCVSFHALAEFNEMLGSSLEDGGIECKFLQDCVGFEMSEICEQYHFDMNKIFTENN